MRRLAIALAAALLLAAAGVAYARLGWMRMETTCGSDQHLTKHNGEVSYSWSWNPTGFHCAYGDGHVETSLWF